MSARRAGITATAVVAILSVVVLLLSASRSITARTFALGAENNEQVGLLHPGDEVCEGPVAGAETSNGVGIWGGGIGGPATMTVTVRDPGTGRTLASGPLRAIAAESQWSARMNHAITSGRAVRICLHEDAGTFTLSGAPAVRSDVTMSGKAGGLEFSLLLLNESRRSLLAWLPTAFERASLWHPSWVGSWTFWLLAVALVATFGLAVAAVSSAAAEDDGTLPPPEPDGDEPDAPSPEDYSKAGQDHPQTVS